MRRMIHAAAVLPLLAAPALAQRTPSDSVLAGSSMGGAGSTSTVANPGQLSVGGNAGSAGTSGPASNAGQLDFSRTIGTGGAPSGSGAGIATGSAGASQTDDTYLYPPYGKSFR